MDDTTTRTYPPGFIKNLRDRVAEVIAGYNAYDVPSICRRYGLATGERDEAMGGKFKYVSKRLFELTNGVVLETARKASGPSTRRSWTTPKTTCSA